MRDGDTIVALSSGALPSGVAVVRISGPQVRAIVDNVAGGVPEPRRLTLRPIGTDSLLDRGLVAYFPAPNSFTGEDCAELQVHGSPAGVRAILRMITAQGARLAEAGEFTRRAFINGKLDLVEIEGLGDLLEAETENQHRQALSRFEGRLTAQVDGWRDQLLDLRAEIEAQLDFSDEGDVGELPDSFADGVLSLHAELLDALTSVERGRITREGLRVALAGAPNAGKSSLLNALAKSDIAIVTDEPGTTRDVREVPIDIGGQLITLLDLAGIRETESKAEAEGVRRALQEIERADLVLWLSAIDGEGAKPLPGETPIWLVGTKSDLGVVPDGVDLAISVTTGQGIAQLTERLAEFAASIIGAGEPVLLSRERDRVALSHAVKATEAALAQVDSPELAAEALRIASQSLERLIGRIDAERVLDRLFASFCIGK
ncbi:tRNA uridine-5-carboxymethylaminomethyl(34) synthesis GTPase MnmE [Devosia sp.]|uniref:tRNA uridine-5-carboxymethylaminomethyl(34) synthesis GTPase MnmE n=1 Tax=Devosia sp. TaxID=1871048 RepID=UPI00326501FA